MTTSPSAHPVRRDPRPKQVGWRSRDILRAAALVAGVYVALQLLWVGRSVFLVGFLGVLIGITLSAGVDRLERWRLPRALGAALLVLAGFGTLVGLGLLTAPRIGEQVRELRQQVPQAIQQVEQWVQQRAGGLANMIQPQPGTEEERPQSAGEQGQRGETQERQAQGGEGQGQEAAPGVDLRRGLAQQLAGAGQTFFAFFSSTLAVLASMIVILFVAIFVAVDPGLYHRGLMHLFPHRARPKAGEVLSATATTLRRWLVLQVIAMILIGSVTTVVLLLLDVRAAVALGIIAGILEFVPYVGPILSAVPAIAMALLDGPEKAIYVAIAYTAIQQLEGVVLQPLLMKEGLELPPVVTILGQSLLALVFGFLGLLVAVPLLATVMVPVRLLYVRDVVGDEMSVPGQDDDG
ncbi:MAG: AI-2E family transporter [Gemmatimonadales bacterium]|nr:AI-2E family transporter [Gemmatimonadales bacterium]MBA3554654.1 AI-2E family transporter [Gemmatimonadales bacterium]